MRPNTRTHRYPLSMAVRYRPAGSCGWLRGETINVSDSGVLFRTSAPTPRLAELLEICLEMSSLGPRNADVVCIGRVIRIETSPESRTRIATTIECPHLSRNAS
jgi:hypothetical protein